MIQEVQKMIEQLHMIQPNDCIVVGVSGGADSVCLLMVLKELQATIDFSIEAIHVEHGIRGKESLSDAAFVETLCARLSVPLTIASVDVPAYSKETGMGYEEAARKLRYARFCAIAKERNAKIALAHHMEDNAETILFQMLRGSSLQGMCGMKAIRTDEQGIVYIRPLLHMHRKEIEAFLQEREQAYCIDSTNYETEYSRNYLRNKVMPQLQELNSKAIEHINATAGHLSLIRDYMESEVLKAWESVVEIEATRLWIRIDAISQLHLALQKEVVHKAIATVAGSRKDIASVHVEAILGLCLQQSGREVVLPYKIYARREYERICIEKASAHMNGADEDIKSNSYIIEERQLESLLQSCGNEKIVFGENGESIELRVFLKTQELSKIPKKAYTKWLDYDKIRKGFCIRKRHTGDYFVYDAMGHTKKLDRYFIDEKIPMSRRDDMWLLAQDNVVLWLLGARISEHIKVTENTNTIIEIKYNGGNADVGLYEET